MVVWPRPVLGGAAMCRGWLAERLTYPSCGELPASAADVTAVGSRVTPIPRQTVAVDRARSDLDANPLWEIAAVRGITEKEFRSAAARGIDDVVALVAERAALPGPRRWTRRDVQQKASVEPILADRLWRAMGFPEVPDDIEFFTDADVEALSIAASLVRGGLIEPEVAVQQTRIMSRLMRRIAATHHELMLGNLEMVVEDARRSAAEDGDDPEKAATAVAADMVTDATAQLMAIDRLLLYLYHRHLASEIDRSSVSRQPGTGLVLAVGFADLVGFTALSQQLGDVELAELVEDFGGAVADIIAELGGQVVKMIGDEAMFSAADPAAAIEAALQLESAIEKLHPDLALRTGVAWGSAVRHEGDLFGPTVNLAARLTALARPATVLVNDTLAELVDADDSYILRPLRTRSLKGLGRVQPYAVRRNARGGSR